MSCKIEYLVIKAAAETAGAEPEVVLNKYLQVTKSFATDKFKTVRVIGTENLLHFLIS
jgi:hypothetical protein